MFNVTGTAKPLLALFPSLADMVSVKFTAHHNSVTLHVKTVNYSCVPPDSALIVTLAKQELANKVFQKHRRVGHEDVISVF